MNRKQTPVLPTDAPGQLYEAPHVISLLLDWLVSDTQPASHNFDQTLSHLIECPDCCTTFRTLLAVLETGGDQLDERSIATFRRLDEVLRKLPITHG
ncbi:MAG TPA: hypothetical protein VNE61_09695 [Ktedonobacteraceae bacterium]|nr:hypothetical protein [Ktedonobacteraceae bacterium]